MPGVPFLFRSVLFRRWLTARLHAARQLSEPTPVVDAVFPGRGRHVSAPDDGPGGTLATVRWGE